MVDGSITILFDSDFVCNLLEKFIDFLVSHFP